MKAKASIMIASGLGAVLWGGVASHGLLAQAEPGPAPAPAVARPAPVKVATDADRRVELNKRLAKMLAEGRGGRLVDAPPPRAAAPATRAPRRRPTSSQSVAPASPSMETVAVAAPLSSRPLVRRASYTPPRLDLTSPVSKPTDPLACLTQAIYYEARNESEEGQAAVAEVVLNRAASGRYPRDVCDVVYQRNSRTCQFTFTCDGSIGRYAINAAAWNRAERIARSVYAGESKAILPARSVNYHANYVRPTWAGRLERVKRIGAHIFYGAPLDGRGTPGDEYRREPPPQRGLLFVKNDAIERAYMLLTGGAKPQAE
jgi:spore germination cell wall hydrolase CwlJ-like protein